MTGIPASIVAGIFIDPNDDRVIQFALDHSLFLS